MFVKLEMRGFKQSRRLILCVVVFLMSLCVLYPFRLHSNARFFFTDLKKVRFIGFRDHWATMFGFEPPYSCICKNGLKVDVDVANFTNPSSIRNADAVIFVLGGRGENSMEQWTNLRKYRHVKQRWVFATRESPQTMGQRIKPPERYRFDTYHWSFSYYSGSDFHVPYGKYYKLEKPVLSGIDWTENKTHLVQWMSSHCPLVRWGRQEFVHELIKRGLPVHVYGSCGDRTCERNSTECVEQMETYKFGLVLENSCCPEYITEKFWKSLRFFQVPVVFGASAEDYRRIAPPNSYIHTENFTSMRELIQYIKKVDADDNLYNSYHKWRDFGYTEQAHLPEDMVMSCKSVCHIASKLDDNSPRWKSFNFYHDSDWKIDCRTCKDIIHKLKDYPASSTSPENIVNKG